MFQVVYKRRAARTLARVPAELRRRIRSSIDTMAKNPDAPGLDAKRLEGREGYRLRVGSWRVLYELDRGRLIVLVIDIGARGDIYK